MERYRFEYKRDRHCLYAVMPDTILPSGNVRVWILGSRDFFGDELTRKWIDEVLEPASPEETERLKSELRKIGYNPD